MRMVLRYDIAAYSGWARQPSVLGVQQLVEEALEMLIHRQIRVVLPAAPMPGARTPPGSALRSDRGRIHRPATQAPGPGPALVRRINGILGRQDGAVWVHEAERAPDGDARFSALARRYSTGSPMSAALGSIDPPADHVAPRRVGCRGDEPEAQACWAATTS